MLLKIVIIPGTKKSGKTKLIPLLNNAGFIRRRSEKAVLRYYLSYNNDEDMARGLLILFFPFRNEIVDIHSHDVKQLVAENLDFIEEKRALYEKYKLMTDLINKIQSDIESENQGNNEDEEDSTEIETTDTNDIENFNQWAKAQASKDLSKFKELTTICNVEEFLRLHNISLEYIKHHILLS